MLSGQEISFIDSLIIAVTGMAIVMFELVLLAFFIFILSKLLAPFSRKKEAVQTAAGSVSVPGSAGVINCGLEDDEIAAVMTAVCQESGLTPEQINIKSIQVK